MPNRPLVVCAALAGAALLHAQPTIVAILNAASNQPVISRDCWVSIYGTRLAAAEAYATAVPLPATLGDTSVFVEDIPIQLSYVSPNQINALMPSYVPYTMLGISANDSVVRVKVRTPEGEANHTIALGLYARAIYSRDGSGSGPALILSPESRILDSVSPGSTVILYSACRLPSDMEVRIGDRPARVDFAGPAPGFAGVNQLNVHVPLNLASDRVILTSP